MGVKSEMKKLFVVLICALLLLVLVSGCVEGIGGKASQRMLGIGFPSQQCEEKSICFDEFNKAQQFSDCSVGEKVYCKFGCIEGNCVNED